MIGTYTHNDNDGQILSVTCDNASNNDTMIDELEILLESFPGAANRTRCFTHILNLVAKSILRQFDVPKAKAGEALDAAATALAALAADLQTEEEAMKMDADGESDEEEDDMDGLVEIEELMTPEEIEELEASIQPVRVVLVKVSSISASRQQTLLIGTQASKTRLRN